MPSSIARKSGPMHDADNDSGQPVRRIVPAGQAAPPVTTGVSSPFAAGRAAGAAAARNYARLPDLPIDKLQVVKNIPLPEPRNRKGATKYDPLLDKLKADGECLPNLPATHKAALLKAIEVYLKRRPALAKSHMVIRHMPDDAALIGIWRVAKAATQTKAGKP